MHLWHWETSFLIFAPQATVLPASAAAAGRRARMQVLQAPFRRKPLFDISVFWYEWRARNFRGEE
jgi:hypothetical protein